MRSRLALLALLALAVGLAVALWPAAPAAPTHEAAVDVAPPAAPPVEAPPVAAPPTAFLFDWPAGTTYTYAVTFSSEGSYLPPASGPGAKAAPLRGELALTGALALRSCGRVDGDWVLGVRLTRVDRLAWSMLGQPVVADDPRALVDREVVVSVTPAGELRALHATPDDPAPLLNLLSQVLAGMQVVVVPGERAWETEEASPLGDARVAYSMGEERPFAIELVRRPVVYLRLAAGQAVRGAQPVVEGESAVTLDRAGHLERVEGEERLSARLGDGVEVLAQRTRIVAELVAVAPGAGGATAAECLAGRTEQAFGDTAVSPDMRTRLLDQRAAGLTAERLAQGFRLHLVSHLPSRNRWLWQATGYLRRYPERCRDLAPWFLASDATPAARALVLDLLAGTGSAEAQAVMRELLASPEARATEGYGMLVQRLSLVASPTDETVEYLRGEVAAGEGNDALAAAHALGATAGKLAASSPAGEEAAALLRERLEAAEEPADRAAWLAALGNAGRPEDVAVVAAYAGDADATVRAAAAGALRKTPTPEAEATLLGLAGDADPRVQMRALAALARCALGPEALGTLGGLVESGGIAPASYPELLNLLSHAEVDEGAASRVVEAMVRRGIADRRLLRRAKDLMTRLRDEEAT